MTTTTRKARKTETPWQKVERWLAGSARGALCYSSLIEAGWEAGQVAHLTVTHDDGCTAYYERFYLDDGRYVVVEWDVDGNVTVC